MQNLKIHSKVLMLTVDAPVEVGQLKATCSVGFYISKNKENNVVCDWDCQDYQNISYMGVPIEGYDNWIKFCKFHREMGIDFPDLLEGKLSEIFTDEFIAGFIANMKF